MIGIDKIIRRENIELLIPHAGEMVLLDSVQHWDHSSIDCRAGTHRRSGNPLRTDEGLSVYAGLEYAAQAMALHSRLCSQDMSGSPKQGLLAVASKIITYVEWLHDIADDLLVSVKLQDEAGGSSLYEFSMTADRGLLLSGCLLVVLAQE